jgi:hypothetical protein
MGRLRTAGTATFLAIGGIAEIRPNGTTLTVRTRISLWLR